MPTSRSSAEAANVDAAVAAAGDAHPDVVLLDLLDAEPRRGRRAADGGAAACGSSSSAAIRASTASAAGGGADAYVEKDAPIDELRDTVLRVAAG